MVHISKTIMNVLPAFKIILSLVWLSLLSSTDAYFSVYVLVAFISILLQFKYRSLSCVDFSIRDMTVSVLLSFSVFCSNYSLFTSIGDPALIGRSTSILMNFINSFFCISGGICIFYPIVLFLFSFFPIHCRVETNLWSSRKVFFLSFVSFISISLIHLFFAEYPGNLTEDSFTQISEMISGSYSNFNTFWHTIMFQAVLTVGYQIFSDLNASVALFCALQAIVLCFSFAYSLMTLHSYGIPKPFLIVSFMMFAFVPYNLALGITVWKDVLFAAGCLLWLSSWFQIKVNIGSRIVSNYLVFILGSILFILSRTNGWIIYLSTFFICMVFDRNNMKLLISMGVIAVLGWFLLNPALTYLGVSGGDKVESLSIPVQQVSRVIADECPLTEEEEALLNRVVDLDEVPQLYTNWLSDPMKVELRSKDYDYFLTNFDSYRDLWIQLGLRYPTEYLKAWIDQTKGYWNAGYSYALYSETVTDNPYGVAKAGGDNPIAALFRIYFGLSRHLILFEPLHSIGLHVWVVFLCFLLTIVKKQKHGVIFIPILLLIAGLWFGTPVFSCFRYVYPLFVSFSMIVSISLFEPVNN